MSTTWIVTSTVVEDRSSKTTSMVPLMSPGLLVLGTVTHSIWVVPGSAPASTMPSAAAAPSFRLTVMSWPATGYFSASVRLSRTSKSTSTSSVDLSG